MKNEFLVVVLLVLFSIVGCDDNVSNQMMVTPPLADNPQIGQINVNVYLENSGSMFGYLGTNSLFKQSTREVLRNIELNHELETFYINDRIYASDKDLNTFIADLSPNGIKAGNQNTSNLTFMLDTLAKASSGNNVSILVTDAIFDIPCDNTSQLFDRLQDKKLEFRNTLVKAVDNEEKMIVVLRMTSEFEGNYYPSCTPGSQAPMINQKRPYFFFIFGDPLHVEKILEEINYSDLVGFENIAKFFKAEQKTLPYTILLSGEEKIGDFRSPRGIAPQQVHEIIDARQQNRPNPNHGNNIFGFGLLIDFENSFLDMEYLLDKGNYLISFNSSDNHSYSVRDISQAGNGTPVIAEARKPVIITIATPLVPFLGDIKLSLVYKLPSWVNQYNSDDDTSIIGDTETTFGLKYLIAGISDAFEYLNGGEVLYDFEVKIKP